MASTSGTGVEIRKFDGKNFALWKEMMQDVLIIRKHVKAIRQSEKLASMTVEEWRSIYEITHSTSNASGRKHLLQHGKRDDIVLIVGEVTSRVVEERSMIT